MSFRRGWPRSAARCSSRRCERSRRGCSRRARRQGEASFCRPIRREDGAADWSRSAGELSRQLRAYTPWPGLYTFLGAERIKVLEALPYPGGIAGEPGALRLEGGVLVVSAGEGTLLQLDRLQRAGKKPVTGAEFARSIALPAALRKPAVTRGKRPAAATARTRAVEALRGVLENARNAAPLVGELARDLPPADQDLLRELVLGVLRWKSALDAEIAGTCRIPMQKLVPGLREIMEVALYQVRHLDRIPQYAAVHAAVDQARAAGGEGAAKLVNGVLRNILLLPAPTPPAQAPLSPRRGERDGVRGWSRRLWPATTRIPRSSSIAGSPASART